MFCVTCAVSAMLLGLSLPLLLRHGPKLTSSPLPMSPVVLYYLFSLRYCEVKVGKKGVVCYWNDYTHHMGLCLVRTTHVRTLVHPRTYDTTQEKSTTVRTSINDQQFFFSNADSKSHYCTILPHEANTRDFEQPLVARTLVQYL